MVAKELRLSDASGPPAHKLLDVQTTRNQLLNSVKKFSHRTALVCLSETEKVLEGLDWSQANNVTNGYVNGHSKEGTNGESSQLDAPYLRLTYAQLYAVALRFATFLSSKGIKRGDSVASFMHTGVEASVVAWATYLLGAVFTPLAPRVAGNEVELTHVLDLTRPSAFIAFDGKVAAKIDGNAFSQDALVKIVSTAGSNKGWLSWHDVLSDKTPLLNIEEDTDKTLESKYTLFVFTSGTTGLPKAAGQTNLSLGTACTSAAKLYEWDENEVVVHLFPFHHIGGTFPTLATWAYGGTVVIPAQTFSPEATVKAMRAESPTNIGAVPSMMLAMHEYDPTPFQPRGKKFMVILTATTILREHYLLAKEYFNMTHFTTPYGASEGLPATGDLYVVKNFDPPPGPINPGKPSAGARIKICAQGSREPIPRNTMGELHQSGNHLIPGYLKKQVEEFYTDEDGVFWFASGDAAVMDDDDNVEILSRLKDMIIRGGVNIAPARIEDVINKLHGVEAFVVGAEDVMAGEVPVAVLRYTSSDRSTSPVQVRETVLKELGPTFALADVILVEDLGIVELPKTGSGKIQKVELRKLVRKHLDEKAIQNQSSAPQPLIGTLTDIWSQILGLPSSKLLPDTDLRDLADSLTTMQFRARLRNTLGKSLSIKQLLSAYTIDSQVKALESLQSTATPRPTLHTKRDGPPQVDEVSFADGDENRFEKIKHLVTTQLTKLGLTWNDDVEDLVPLWDWGQWISKPLRLKSFIHRHAFVSESLSKADLRQFFEKAITSHSTIRTLGIQESEQFRFLAVLRPNQKFFENCIYDAGSVEKASDLAELHLRDTQGSSFFPGLLFKLIFADVKETGTAGFVFISQHAIFDAGSIGPFFENLSLVMEGSAPNEKTNYKAWADMYYSNRTSVKATQGVRFRTAKLKGTSPLKKALWPPQKAPGFYFGDDINWLDPDTMQPGDPALRPRTEPDENVSTGIIERGLTAPYDQGVTRAFELPNLFKLQQAHRIHPVTLVQNALVLATMYQTKQRAAFLSLAMGGRSWPFLPREIEEILPEAVDVDGPMVQMVPHITHLPETDSVITFLQAQQKEQQALSQYAHAPLLRIKEELGTEDGNMLMQILRHQAFNWLPIIGKGGMGLKGFRNVQKTHHNDFMVTWAAGMPDAETLVVHADVDQAQLTVKEVQRAQELLEKAALWMTDQDNWDKPVAEFLGLNV